MRIKIEKIRQVAEQRPEGYFEDVTSSGEISECGEWLTLTEDEYVRLFNKYNEQQINHQQEATRKPERLEGQELSMYKKVSSALGSASNWAISGFPLTQKDILKSRIEVCVGCDLWDSAGFGGTGRCKKCGCSTQAKLRMASEKCPLGKW